MVSADSVSNKGFKSSGLISTVLMGLGGSGAHIRVGDAEKPWRAAVDSIIKEMDSYGEQFGHTVDEKLRSLNKKNFSILVCVNSFCLVKFIAFVPPFMSQIEL